MNKNVRLMVVNGLGVAAGAVLAGVSAMATANADKVITVQTNSTPVNIVGDTAPTTTDVNVVHSSIVNIENNHAYTNTDIVGGAADNYNQVNIYNNSGPSNMELSTGDAGAVNYVHSSGDYGSTNVELDTSGQGVLNHVWLVGDHGPNTVDIDSTSASGINDAAIEDNYGVTNTDITDLASGTTAAVTIYGNALNSVTDTDITTGDNAGNTLIIADNGGQTVTDLSSGSSAVSTNTISIYGNSQLTTINLDQEGETTNISIGAIGATYPGNTGDVVINDPNDVAPVYISDYLAENGTLPGTVTADIDGVTTVIPAGDEYEFVNGTVDVISTNLF